MTMKNKILIISGCDNSQLEFGQYSFDLMRKYADKHGYDVKIYTGEDFYFAAGDYFNDQTTREFNWVKVSLVAIHIENYDYVIWLDADAFIMRHDLPLDEVFKFDDHHDFYVAPDAEYQFNVGVFAIKNTPFSLDLMREWSLIGLRENDHVRPAMSSRLPDNVREQGALINLWLENWKGLLARTKILHSRDLNAHLQKEFWRAPYDPEYQYEHGHSFILHLAGVPTPQRVSLWLTIYSALVSM